MKRREAMLALLALGTAPGPAWGQTRVRRLGYLGARAKPNELDAAFFAALGGFGYVEGRTLQVEYRWGAGDEQRAEMLAGELVAQKVELIVTATTAAVRGAARRTKTVPIVMAASSDPVGAGLVASLARPGGNVTGLTLISTDTAARRLQLLRELVPAATVVAVVLEGASEPGPQEVVNRLLIGELREAARQLGLTLIVQGVRNATGYPSAFEALQRGQVHATLVQVSRLAIDNRQQIAELAARHRLPAMYETEVFVASGGLVSFGPNLADMYRRAAGYADRILRGARPAELPVEQPTKFDLVINAKTASALGLKIPQSLLLRADRVIE